MRGIRNVELQLGMRKPRGVDYTARIVTLRTN